MDLIIENAVNKAVEKATRPLIAEIKFLKDELNSANNAISKLKNVIKEKDKDGTIEKLNNTINSQNYKIDKLDYFLCYSLFYRLSRHVFHHICLLNRFIHKNLLLFTAKFTKMYNPHFNIKNVIIIQK